MSARLGRVLVIDDENQIRRFLSLALRRYGYEVETASTGEDALLLLAESKFDILLLDMGLPDMEGQDLCREIREWSDVPIIVVSVRNEDREKVAALDAGADDYVTKPFSIPELLARMRANARRVTGHQDHAPLALGPLQIDIARRQVVKAGIRIHLTPTEYELLKALAGNAGRVLTHKHLLTTARGLSYGHETPILRVHMSGLRQKLNIPSGRAGHIVTEPGVGYRILDEDIDTLEELVSETR